MFTTKSHGPLAHTDGWHTTSPEALREEAERIRKAREQCKRIVVRRQGARIVRIAPDQGP